MKRTILAAMAMLIFGGCGIYTRYSRPEEVDTDAGELFRGEAALMSDSTRNFGDEEWQKVFTDPYLQRLIDSALVRNTDLRTARLRITEAEASLKAAKLAYVPSFSFAPNGGVSSFDYGKAQYTYSVPVTASWQLDIFGQLTNAKRRTQALVEGSRAYAQAVRTQLVASVANTYYTLLMLDAQLDIAEDTAENWFENLETMRLLKDAGMTNEASVRQTEANYYSVRTMVHDLREQIFVTENAMSSMLCQTPQHIERGVLAGQTMPEELHTGVPVQLLSNRPDVAYAEDTLMQAFYATNEARAAMYPRLTLSGSAGWTNTAGSAIVNPGSLLLSAAASLLQPIFQNGALRAQLKIAKAQQEQAMLSFRQTVLNAGNEVNEALEQYQTAREKRELFEKQVEALEAAVENTQLLMEHGSSTYLEVLTAQQSLLSAQISMIENRFDEIQGVVNLYQALGGGRETGEAADTAAKPINRDGKGTKRMR